MGSAKKETTTEWKYIKDSGIWWRVIVDGIDEHRALWRLSVRCCSPTHGLYAARVFCNGNLWNESRDFETVYKAMDWAVEQVV